MLTDCWPLQQIFAVFINIDFSKSLMIKWKSLLLSIWKQQSCYEKYAVTVVNRCIGKHGYDWCVSFTKEWTEQNKNKKSKVSWPMVWQQAYSRLRVGFQQWKFWLFSCHLRVSVHTWAFASGYLSSGMFVIVDSGVLSSLSFWSS